MSSWNLYFVGLHQYVSRSSFHWAQRPGISFLFDVNQVGTPGSARNVGHLNLFITQSQQRGHYDYANRFAN